MRYSNENIVGNYLVLNSVDTDNLYLINGLKEHNIRGNIKKDVYGRTEKLFKFFEKYNLIIDSVKILDKNSRKSKIDSFLSNLYDDVAESMIISIGSLNYDIVITLEKNSKGITNVCKIMKNGELYKEINISDFNKDIKYISKIIKSDKFTISEFLDSYLLKVSNYDKHQIEYLNEFYDTFLYKYEKYVWDSCIIERVEKNSIKLELFIQKGNNILNIEMSKYYSSKSLGYATIKSYKSLNQSFISCDSYTNFEEALNNFK